MCVSSVRVSKPCQGAASLQGEQSQDMATLLQRVQNLQSQHSVGSSEDTFNATKAGRTTEEFLRADLLQARLNQLMPADCPPPPGPKRRP